MDECAWLLGGPASALLACGPSFLSFFLSGKNGDATPQQVVGRSLTAFPLRDAPPGAARTQSTGFIRFDDAGPAALGSYTRAMDIAALRKSYERDELDESASAADPLAQFQRWFDQALHAALPEPNAMTLATVGADGRPSTRIVLIKGCDARGIVWSNQR